MIDRKETMVSIVREINNKLDGGLGNDNLLVGTEAERLAYTKMVEGTEWNQTGGTEVKKFIYSGTAWIELVSGTTTYLPFPSNWVTSGTLQLIVTSILADTLHAKEGMAYLGGISGACTPFGYGNAECKVEFMLDGLAVLSVNSSNIEPYAWHYNTASTDYTWKPFGGGDSNLIIGTEEERLAYEDPYQGLEWNLVNYDAVLLKYSITRYLYENTSWKEIESPQTEPNEKVSLHVSTYDGLGTLTGHAVGVTDITGGTVLSLALDSSGNCNFQIPKNHSYTISVASLSGYHDIPDSTYLANMDERSVSLVFLAIPTLFETIIVHSLIYNKNLVDITTSDTYFIGHTVTCAVTGGATTSGVLDNNHNCLFQVPYGSTYTVSTTTKEGYRFRYPTSSVTHTASVPQRTVVFHLMQWEDSGIFGVKLSDGTLYDYSTIEAMSAAERAEIGAIAINTLRLSSAGAGFMYKLPVSTQGKQWANLNVAFDPQLLPYKTSHATAVLDLDGATNTQKIIDIGDSMQVETPAADWVVTQTLTVNGVTKNGFLGAFGQMYALSENIAVLNSLHTLLGVAQPGFTSGLWWSSTLYSGPGAVSLYLGSFGDYFYTKTSSYTTFPLFAL